MTAWDPDQYLKFAGERLRPAMDLLARIDPGAPPGRVVDLGCGAGNVTRALAARWPGAGVTGVDASPAMLAEARAGGGIVEWIEADLAGWRAPAPLDVLFSNAALHWLDDHQGLFPELLAQLAPGGVLAVQMPRNHGALSHTCMLEAAAAGPWRVRLEPVLRASPVAPPEVYYDLLAGAASRFDIWETVYTHVLDGDDPVLEWTAGTALRPLLDALDGDQPARAAFLDEYRACLARAYPRRPDGRTLFAFRRLFMVAVA